MTTNALPPSINPVDLERALGTSVSFADVFAGKLPAPGDPDLWDELMTKHPPKPIPPPKPPAAVFDRERLTITANGVELDLLAMKAAPDGSFELGIDHRKFGDAWPEVQDAIEDAYFETFASRRIGRALAIENYNEAHFDLEAMIAAGYTFDWQMGAIHPPQSSTAPASGVRPLFCIHPNESGEDELLLDHYLERGGAMLIAGPTGIGKSSIMMQFSIGWSLNQPVLGFEPSRNLSVLIVQAENADHDLCRMRDGMVRALELDEHQAHVANEFVAVVRSDELTGRAFGDALTRHIREWQPDIVIIDPLLAFVGGDISKQEVASEFLRQVLQPIARRARVGVIALHHTGKPPKDDRGEAPLPDYIGLGSSELANWPRAVVAISRVKGQRGVFRMELGKRGQNLGWTAEDGSLLFEKTIAHSTGGIHWREIDATEQAKVAIASAASKDTLLALVPADGSPVPKDALISMARDAKIGVNRAEGWLATLLAEKKLFEWFIPRTRTRPQRLISRQPQPPQTDLPLPS